MPFTTLVTNRLLNKNRVIINKDFFFISVEVIIFVLVW